MEARHCVDGAIDLPQLPQRQDQECRKNMGKEKKKKKAATKYHI